MIWFKVILRVFAKFYENTYILWNWLGCSLITYLVILTCTKTPLWGQNNIYQDFRLTAFLCSLALGVFVYGIIFLIYSELAAPARTWLLKIKREVEAEENKKINLRLQKDKEKREVLNGTNLKIIKPLNDVE